MEIVSGFSVGFLFTAFIAGILTVLSPCVLPMLPIVISGSVATKSLAKAGRIIGALAVSVTAFSLLLKASTVLFNVPDDVWRWLSGSILILFGILTFWPQLWDKLSDLLGLKKSSHKLLGKGLAKSGAAGDLLVGASLGPVFTSCSPAYLSILGYITLQQDLLFGLIYLLAFVIGLSLILFLVAIFGQKFVSKIAALSNPKSYFKRILAVVFVMVGVLVFAGWDKDVEIFLLDRGLYDWLIDLEDNLPQLPGASGDYLLSQEA